MLRFIQLGGLLLCLVVCGCGHWVPYRPLTISNLTYVPDRLYAATVRAMVRRGWGLQNRDPSGRVVETEWFEWNRSDWRYRVQVAYRVLIRRGEVEIFTSCRLRVTLGVRECPGGRPPGVAETESQLAREILNEAASLE